ncbi:hypothetical protein ACU8DI_05190 [Psychroserpens sp. BH13MA-6]
MQQFANFEQDISNLTALGVKKATERTTSYNTGDYPDGLVLSSDPSKSHIPAEIITVKDVKTLKELCGVSNTMARNVITDASRIPPNLNTLKEAITDPFHPHICNAMSEYVFGDSTKVDSWEGPINDLRFPMQVSIFTADNINVQPGKPLKLEGTDEKPIALVVDKITVESGGQIVTKGPGKVSSKEAISADPTTPSTVTLLSIGGDGGDGGVGGNGSDAGPGSKGPDASKNGKHGCNDAGAGGKGGDGTGATKGGDGGDGGEGGIINFSFPVMEGNFTVGSIGGNGGDGGRGGNGGNGGPGGPGGDSCRTCGKGAQGPGGNGGDAGDGGLAGNGGNGQKVYINYNSGSPKFQLSPQKANGGKGGSAGTPGKYGTGNPNGKPGASGKSQDGGKGGTPGQVIINGSPIS